MTSFATPSAAVHEKLPDSSTPSGSCQALPRPAVCVPRLATPPPVRARPVPCPAVCVPRLTAPPPVRARPVPCPTPFGKTGEGRGETTPPTPPPVRSHPLPRLAVCVPHRSAQPPVRALLRRPAARACPSSLPRRPCDPIHYPASPCACLTAPLRRPCDPIRYSASPPVRSHHP